MDKLLYNPIYEANCYTTTYLNIMTLLIFFILKLIILIGSGLMAVSTITVTILSYLGYDFVLYEAHYHLMWLSLICYSVVTLLFILGEIIELFRSLTDKQERAEAIAMFKYQLSYERDWIKNSILFQILTQLLVFIKNVVSILFKRFFKH
uniref:hypothetical protein n=1 Tax=Porodaedalea mongolica TaxID=2651638 RepID=UPI0021AC1DB5|nr:hypothetical protein NYK79_mgp21 [Porodaedalea mongolica]UUA03969.1 hypothetical protein [Porodaedalea mongolica]WCF76736.1 hypothetical protein [Porodaedalea mongolica]